MHQWKQELEHNILNDINGHLERNKIKAKREMTIRRVTEGWCMCKQMEDQMAGAKHYKIAYENYAIICAYLIE